MTWEEKILSYLNKHPGFSDRELSEYFNVSNQAINSPCRSLAKKGLINRIPNPQKDGIIGNYPIGKEPEIKYKKTEIKDVDGLQEEDIKTVLTNMLKDEGWKVTTAWGHQPGVDIDAKKGNERWLIEVKGPGSRSAMRVNYFLSILGEMLQRMDDPNARYSIALPDLKQYRGLWERLPKLAKERTTIDLILVDTNKNITYFK